MDETTSQQGPWNLDALSAAPEVYPADGFAAEGVRPLFYRGPDWQGRPTRVFAWYGVPEQRTDRKLPAMVLVHGGGGTAFDDWVRLWNSRGYAAIAMDTCGCVAGGEHANRPRHEHGGPPGWGGFEQIDQPVHDQWPYHAVADVILANSLLRSFPEIDPQRIGVTGVSWGGYLTCIVSGVDSRFRFAAPVYGCGYLHENSGWLDTFAQMGPEKAHKWWSLWDPSVYLPRAAMPMLWVSGTNDSHYPLDSLQKSYRLPEGPRTLSIRVNMPHGQDDGAQPGEIAAFADHHLHSGPPLPSFGSQRPERRHVWITFFSKTPIVRAELNYTTDMGPWVDRQWHRNPVDLDPGQGRVIAPLPEATTAYYVNLIDNRDLVTSGEHVELASHRPDEEPLSSQD
ncbi:MAG: prolyl oligopeptidase family serine peptidase [Phycisphaerae bacterium]|nr:prolyl oligopeptidase family serine peptidase [Phycisphaerae bacterium]